MAIWKKLLQIVKRLNPSPKVGGLEVSDALLRLIFLEKDKKVAKEASFQLAGGIIENGRIKDKARFSEALTALLKQAAVKRPANVVVSIPAANVYLQVFNLPPVARTRLEESARLNLQMISPINIKSAYYDWEILDEKTSGPADLLGAFAVANDIDDLTGALEGAGFNVAAIESASMSLARALKGGLPDLSKPHICLRFSGDGMDFFILKNGHLYFNYFVSWAVLKESGKEKINLEKIKEEIDRELRRLSSFYVSKWGQVIEDLVLIGVSENKQVASHIKNNFSLKIHNFLVSAAWGAALRGLLPRSEDHFISLAKTDTEEKFFQARIMHFTHFWRNILVTSALVMMAAYAIFDGIIFWSVSNIFSKLRTAPPVSSDSQSIGELEIKAGEFNALVAKALKARNQSLDWSLFFSRMQDLAGRSVELTKIQIDQATMVVNIGGRAGSEKEVLDFKNVLSKDEDFTDISLPLTAIKTDIDGKANFTMTFKIKNWPI